MPIFCALHYNRKSVGNNELQTLFGKHITYKHQKTPEVTAKADFIVANEYFTNLIKRTLKAF